MTAPADIDMERGLLGAALAYTGVVADVSSVVPELVHTDFFLVNHQDIWESIVSLGEKADLITVSDALQSRGLLDRVGGLGYLADLTDAVGTAVNATFYACRIRDLSVKRRLGIIGQKITHISSIFAGSAADAIDQAEAAIQALRTGHGGENGLTRFGDSEISESLKNIEELSQGKCENVAIPTGFTDIDKMIGGCHAADLVILAGRPSMGKTALALALIVNATLGQWRESGRAQGTTDVAFFSLEMSREQIFIRLLSMISGIDSAVIRSGEGLQPDDFGAIAGAADYVQRSRIWIDDTAAQTDAEVTRKTKRLQAQLAREGRSIGLVVVDYLQLMKSSRRHERKDLEVGEIGGSLKALAKGLGACVVALSQLNRQVEARTDKRPLLSDLRESGALEQDADVVAMMYRPGYYNNDPRDNACEVLIRKNRNGPTGTCRMWVDLPTGKFRTAQSGVYR
jgi:replicative DNA helicase